MAGGFTKKAHPDHKKHRIQDPRYQYPLPQVVFADEPVRLKIGLYRYDHFFQQMDSLAGEGTTFSKFTAMNGITQLHSHKLPPAFYRRKNVCSVARSLIGKLLVTGFNGALTAGRIVETEAYDGVADRAAHSWNGRRTARTEIMYAPGGVAYVYLCYGIHHLFNVVTSTRDVPKAVLIRSVEPVAGIDIMLERTRKIKADHTLTRGPGNVAKALGIHTRHTGTDLQGPEIFIADDGYTIKPSQILATPRIGVDYAGTDALLPYRFIVKDNPFVSGTRRES